MKRRSLLLVSLPALMLVGLVLPAATRDARARQQHLPGRSVGDSEVPLVYVTGKVVQPLAIDFKAPLTVTRAIAAAGGLRGDANKDLVCVIHPDPTGGLEPTVTAVDLKAIRKRRASDFPLRPYDIVDVLWRGIKQCPEPVSKELGAPSRVIH